MDEDAPDEREIAEVIAHLTSQIQSPEVERRREGARQLYDLCYTAGTRARAAMPVLVDCLSDSDEQIGDSAVWGLRYCAPDSVEPLIDCLTSPDAKVRRRACDALGNIGDDALPASEALRRLLADSVQGVRTRAAWALGLLHDTSEKTIAALAAMARRDSAALHALGNIGTALVDPGPLRAMQPEILNALEDDDRDVRRSACHALAALDLEPMLYLDVLTRRLADEPVADIRYLLVGQLKDLAPTVDLSGHIPLMCDVVRRGSMEARSMCDLLALLGPKAKAAVPTLADALRHEDGQLVVAAAEALWAITRRANELLPALARVFHDEAESVCDAICEIGPAAAPLAGKLIDALQSDDYWDLQWAAADALGAIASDADVISTLGKALAHPSPIVKSAAARALARVGPAAAPMLIEMLENNDDERGEWAADVIGRIGQPAASAAEVLRAHLRSDNAVLAGWSATALAKVTGDSTLTSLLVELLCSERVELRQEAAMGLKAIGPPAAAALEALRGALDDDDADVRAAAQKAIAALTAPTH